MMDSKKDQLIEEIEQITESVALKAGLLEEQINDRYAGAKKTIDKTISAVATATKALAPALIIRAHPWLATGSAVLGGVLIARRLLQDNKARKLQQATLPANTMSQSLTPEVMPAPKQSFLARHEPEVRVIRNLALTALTRYAAKRLKARAPHLTNQIQIAEESVTGFLR